MRKLIITESEKRNILRQHGSLILEQSAAEKLAQIQTALGTSGDKIIGPDTTKRIVSALQGLPKESGDFTCVTNLKNDEIVTITNSKGEKTEDNVEVIDMTMKGADGKTTGGMEYQIGEILFKPNGTYFDLNQPNTPIKYTCSAGVIQTSNHGNIEKGSQKVDNTKEIESKIKQYRDDMELSNEVIVKTLLKKYSAEDIIKADASLEPLVNKTGTTVKPETTQKAAAKGEEEVRDENNLFDLSAGTVTDKLGTRPVVTPK